MPVAAVEEAAAIATVMAMASGNLRRRTSAVRQPRATSGSRPGDVADAVGMGSPCGGEIEDIPGRDAVGLDVAVGRSCCRLMPLWVCRGGRGAASRW